LLFAGCIEISIPSKSKTHSPPSEPTVSAPPSGTPKGEYIYHKVMAGETMGTIAKWYAGDSAYWVEIAEENAGIKPTELHVGDMIKIPASMAKVHKEQPSFSTATIQPKSTKKASKQTATSTGSETTGGPPPAVGSTTETGTAPVGAPPPVGGSPATTSTTPSATGEPCFGPR
jgi:hypothetical protein